MRNTFPFSCLLLIGTVGCLDYTPKGEDVSHDAAADISVTPGALDFGGLNFDEAGSADLTVENLGDATLNLSGTSFSGSTAFDIGALPSTTLEPGESEVVTVRYTPLGHTDDGDLVFSSDDPDEPELSVPLLGAGLYPELVLSDDPLKLGTVSVGCSTGEELTLTNIGEGRGTVSDLGVIGDEFSLVRAPALPFVLESGESVTLAIGFTAETDGAATADLWVSSDDPASPLEGTVTATGDPLDAQTDRFWQGPFESVDMIITVDRSGSMDDDARKLAANFHILIETLVAAGVDYQIGVVTEDSGCVNDTVFTPDTEDAEDRFAATVLGYGGTYTEAGLTLARNALEAAGSGVCNDGLLRDDARTALVFVSDEPEQSWEDKDALLAEIQATGHSVIANAVAGPVPEGCGSAEPGRGYDAPVTETGGVFLSICDADWGDGIAEIATGTTADFTTRFALSGTPIPSSIVVTVDGTETSTWAYDEDDNSIVFTATTAPETGEMIAVSYDIAGACD